MLSTLLESNPAPQRRRAGAIASIALHTLLIAAAIAATASARTDVPPVIADPPVIHTDLWPTSGPTRSLAGRDGPVTRRETIDVPSPPRVSFSIDAEAVVPEIDVAGSPVPLETPFDRERGAPFGRVGEGPGGAMGEEPRTIAHVDRPVAMLAPPRPRYPDQLRAAGITGRVVLRLVVDTTGRVERETVTVLESSHDLFARAVIAVLPSLRFTPAEAGGRKVRMLVVLPFEFRLNE
jgi:protein TonB